MLFVMTCLASGVARADNAPMWESPQGLAPGGPNVTVRMADEQVDIKVVEQGGNPLAVVNATFDMANDGPAATMLTGFPNSAYSALVGSDYDPVTFTPARITNFKAWTDSATFTPTSRQVTPSGQRFGSDWFVWNMSYPQGKTIAVHVAYQQQLDAGYTVDWSHVSYVLRTGALWNGPIGKATISMASDAGALMSTDPVPQQQEGGKLIWSFENFKPTQDINALYINGRGWAKLQAAQSAASAPGATSADLVSSANAVLDVVISSDRSQFTGTLYRMPPVLVNNYFLPAWAWAYAARDADPSNAAAWELLGDMASISQAGKGLGPPTCWPSEALNAYQQAADLGSSTAGDKLSSLADEFPRFNLTASMLPDCGSGAGA
jgi:hypothetical protein